MSKLWQLRPNQLKAFAALQGKSRCIANMPTGWGKSFLLCCLCASDLLDKNRKVVLCVPQRIIAKGFKQKRKIQLSSGKITNWSLPQNLCDPTSDKVNQLLHFLTSPATGEPECRIVLATHLSLSIAFERVPPAQIASVFANTSLYIDESHHVQASEQGQNSLGQVVGTLLDLNDPTFKIIMATAYFFRGDHLPIIPENHLARFHRYHVPFDEYWSSLKHVKTFAYDFVAFKGTVFPALEELLKQDQSPTIIYCPPEGHKMLLGKSKANFVRRLIALCERLHQGRRWSPALGAIDNQKVVIDLVDAEHRTEKIRFIEEHGDKVAVILTVGMFKEGADWIEAARVIDLVPSGSDQDRLQRFGRLVRDCEGKSHVSYYSFFPFVVEVDEEKRRKELTKLYAHFHASLVLENAIRPIKVKVGQSGKRNGGSDERGPYLNLLGQLSESTQESIFADSFASLVTLQAERGKHGLAVQPNEAKDAIFDALRSNGVTENLEPLAKQVILVMRRKANITLHVEDLVEAGFDKVWATDAIAGVVAYSGEIGGPTTLAEIRRVVDCVFGSQWMAKFEEVRNLPHSPDTQSTAYWWCTHNRVLHQSGALELERQKRLESIPWWQWTESIQDRWQTQFDELRLLGQPPKSGTVAYNWMRQQRRQNTKGLLDGYKAKLLESIKWWSWQSNHDQWESKFEAIAELPDPPARGTTSYEWMRTQRKAFHDGSLSDDRQRLLESITWWTWGEGSRSRDKGLELLATLIGEAERNSRTKAQVRQQWSEALGITEDQINKYLKLLSNDHKAAWKRLRSASPPPSRKVPR